MDDLNLDSDESVIYTAGKIIINGVGHEAILTGKRLFLRESETGKARDDIPYSEIELAASGTNALREPVIFITARLPDGTTRETELIFFHQAGGQNARDRDRCLAILRDQKVGVAAGPSLAVPLPPGIRGTAGALTPADEEPPVRPAVPEMSIYGMTGTTRQTETKEPTDSTPVIMIAAALIVLVVLAAGIFFTGPGTGTGTGIRNLTQATATVTAAVTSPAPTPMPTPVPVSTLATAATSQPPRVFQPGEIPPSGTYVKVDYPGKYYGSISALGQAHDVNTSGVQVFQIPLSHGSIDGSIEKSDGSDDNLIVQVFRNGALVTTMNTSIPLGVVDIHLSV